MVKTPRQTIATTWELRTYDVLGNSRDGYQVNDTYDASTVRLLLTVEKKNEGTPAEFTGAYPTDRQIRLAFGVKCRLELDGDDTHITVNRERDGYPIGEMHCTSHESLSPIRPVKTD